MKSYLMVSGTIFGLLAVGHVYELFSNWRTTRPDPGFLGFLAAVVVLSGGLSLWAFRLVRAHAATGA